MRADMSDNSARRIAGKLDLARRGDKPQVDEGGSVEADGGFHALKLELLGLLPGVVGVAWKGSQPY